MRLKSGILKRTAAFATAVVLAGSLVVNSAVSAFAEEAAVSTTEESVVQTLADPAAATNIALGKTVTASGTSDGNKDNVVDGDINTKWDSEFLKHPDPNHQIFEDSTLTVNLGEAYQVSSVTVKFFKKKIYATNYDLQLSPDGTTWTTAKTVTHPDGDNSLLHLVEPIPLDAPVLAQQVRLVFHSVNSAAAGNGVGVTEFEIYGEKPQQPDPKPDPEPQPNPDPEDPNVNNVPEDPYRIYPIPQNVRYPGGEFVLDNSVNLVVGEGVDQATVDFAKEVLQAYNLTVVPAEQVQTGISQILLGVQEIGRAHV